MGQILGFLADASVHWWATIEGICAVVLVADALTLLLAQRGARGQRRWAALGPLVAAIFAAVIAWGTWAADQTFFHALRVCVFVPGSATCRGGVTLVDQQAQIDIEVLAWLVVGVTVGLALITAALLVSGGKPADGPQPSA